ncbi:MAG: HD domain-containing protein [Deltaproteobacteria bacterium]|nr:HD domain-containing protein [Deltaproteobacteria bacterium]
MLQGKALEILRVESHHGKPLENHCLRLAEFSLALADSNGIEMDEDLTFAACYLHDIGLCVKDPSEKNYLKRGLKFVRTRIGDWGLDDHQIKVLEDVMLYSHSISSMPGTSPEGDLVRRAVSVEHSLGRLTHGLSSAFCKDIFAKYPRRGFNRVLLDFFKIAILEDGPKELVRIFFPERS